MSAICAIFSPAGVSAGDARTMQASLEAYPHDASGSWASGPVALAACTLHTTAESLAQDQPMVTQGGTLACAFDGHLINHEEIGVDLEARGISLQNKSDVEIALKAYEVWGEGCADRLQGEFAFIIADVRKGRVFAARDHMGLVPLYFLEEDGRLIVASDIRTIVALKPKALEPNLCYLAQMVAKRWYLRGETAWKQIRRVQRAHTLTYDGGAVREQKYWTPSTDVTIRYRRDEEYVEHYLEVLTDCLRRASRSHVPVGVAVSGGLDSSALFALADRLENEGQWRAPSFHGYSLAARVGSSAYELPYARAVASHVGRPLSELPLFDPDIDYYSKDAAWHCDFAAPSNAAMMRTMESQVVSDGARVIISGSGGDEWLQGQAHAFPEYLDEGDLAGLYRTFRNEAAYLGYGSALKDLARQTAVSLVPAEWRQALRTKMREKRRADDVAIEWLAPELRIALREAEEAYEADMPADPIEWSKVNLATSPRRDLSQSVMQRQRNQIGIEARHPMFHRSFIEFSLSTPNHIKRRGSLSKVIHRKAMEPYLPAEVLNRTNKANFANTKIDHQFAQYVRQHAAERLGTLCDLRGLTKILDIDFKGPDGDYWAWEIWGLYASAAFLYQANCTGQN